MSRGLRAAAGRLSWGLADQAVSSLTNFAVGIYVARSLGVIAFGIFSIALVTYAMVLNVSRGLATDPLVVRFSAVATDVWRGAVARASGTALRVGILAGLCCVLIGVGLHGIEVGGKFGKAFVALGFVLPALMLQDSWRFAFFAAGQGRKAFLNDVVWGLALIPLLFFAAQRGSVVGSVLAWGLSAAVAAGYGCVQAGVLPRLGGVRGWLLEHRDLGTRYLLENVSLSGSTQLRMYGVGAIAGLAAVGTIRGAELLLGPFLAVLMGLSLVTVAEAARTLRRSPHRLRLFCMAVGGGQAAAALVWGLGLLFLLSDEVGERILGQVWGPSSALILPVTFGVVGASFSTGASAGLRALGAARRSLRAQLFMSVTYVTAGLVGAAMAGALGSAWGVAAATLTGSVVWWYQLNSGLRDRRTSLPADPDPAATAPASQTEMRMP
jgi:O-antigen/teichoic acid export membrane protein